MVQDGFQLSQLLRDGQPSFDCVGIFDVVVIALHVIFCFFQTFYIFKSHRVRLTRCADSIHSCFTVKPRIHDTAGCTTGWTNYVNELSQRAQPSGLVTAG